MLAAKWIIKAQSAGWRVVSSRGGSLHMACDRQGCPGTLKLPINNLGPTPEPCGEQHHGKYGQPAFDQYRDLVAALSTRRRLIGLSQEDVNGAAGLADGHINKLEAFDRTAQFPTLQLWANTVGLKITLSPAPLPAATARAIERRPKPLLETRQQRQLFDER